MADTTIEKKPDLYLNYFDSARGIAALMVMVYHFLVWHYGEEMPTKIASIVFNGSDAVSFFFVLSGFVLSYKYIVLGQTLDIRKFYINRMFRLWPAFFVIIAITTLNGNKTPESFSPASIFIFDKTDFWEEAFLLRTRPKYYIPAWTLSLELSFSFFIPFLIALAKQNRKLIYWFLIAIALMGGAFTNFTLHFTLGVVVSCVFAKVSDESFKETKWYRYRYLLIAISMVFFSIRHIDRLSHLGPSLIYMTQYLNIDFFMLTGLASFVFIVAIIGSKRTQKILSARPLRFFGKISYGVYLCHWVCVQLIYEYWDKILLMFPNFWSAFLSTFLVYWAVVTAFATLIYHFVEVPCINWGKRITSKMRPSLQI